MTSASSKFVTVLFFASAREAAGNVSETELPIPEADDEASDCFDTDRFRTVLSERYPGLAAFLQDDRSVTLAVNEEYVPPGHAVPLKHGDTVALIPPISGG
jgi:molybdopterin converting factor subunit 1